MKTREEWQGTYIQRGGWGYIWDANCVTYFGSVYTESIYIYWIYIYIYIYIYMQRDYLYTKTWYTERVIPGKIAIKYIKDKIYIVICGNCHFPITVYKLYIEKNIIARQRLVSLGNVYN